MPFNGLSADQLRYCEEVLKPQVEAEMRQLRLKSIREIGALRVLHLAILPCWTGRLVTELDFPLQGETIEKLLEKTGNPGEDWTEGRYLRPVRPHSVFWMRTEYRQLLLPLLEELLGDDAVQDTMRRIAVRIQGLHTDIRVPGVVSKWASGIVGDSMNPPQTT